MVQSLIYGSRKGIARDILNLLAPHDAMAELFKIPLVGEELGSSVLYVGPSLGLGYSAPYKRKSVSAAFVPDS